MKLREEREARRATMDGRHEYVLSTVADRLQMSMEDAEEFMLDGDQVSVGEGGGGATEIVSKRNILLFLLSDITDCLRVLRSVQPYWLIC